MKRTTHKSAIFSLTMCSFAVALSAPAFASDAETSARATGGGWRAGAAAATARYDGDLGFARTDTRTGNVNAARAVAIGVDADGVTLSVSLAVAPQRGPGFATTFNMSFDRDGGGGFSTGRSLATGGTARTVLAGGRATNSGYGPTAMAGGSTIGGGRVYVHTQSKQYERREVAIRRIIAVR